MAILSSDFKKYALSKGISSLNYERHVRNISHHIVDENSGIMVDIYSKLLNDRIVFLTDEIDNYSSEILKAQLLYLESINNDDIKMYINSVGGSVYDGLGILDVMEYITPDISTINTGLAASMAAIILCCGAKGKRKSLKRSRTMIHQPLGFAGFQQASDMEIEAREINLLKKELYKIISEQTGQDMERVTKDGDRNYWLSSQEAKKYGMIDEIIIKRK